MQRSADLNLGSALNKWNNTGSQYACAAGENPCEQRRMQIYSAVTFIVDIPPPIPTCNESRKQTTTKLF